MSLKLGCFLDNLIMGDSPCCWLDLSCSILANSCLASSSISWSDALLKFLSRKDMSWNLWQERIISCLEKKRIVLSIWASWKGGKFSCFIVYLFHISLLRNSAKISSFWDMHDISKTVKIGGSSFPRWFRSNFSGSKSNIAWTRPRFCNSTAIQRGLGVPLVSWLIRSCLERLKYQLKK